MVHLDYRSARPIYAQIIDGLRQQITAGVLLPGEKLLSERAELEETIRLMQSRLDEQNMINEAEKESETLA